MPEKVVPGPVSDNRSIREAVCIHTRKIFDSCKDKDCIEDLRVYPTRSSQTILDQANCVKAGQAELLYAYINVEPISFNKGFYTVDVRYFYRITGEEDLYAAGFFDYLDGTRVLAVEWSERVPSALPQNALHIDFEPLSGDARRITITGDERLAALQM